VFLNAQPSSASFAGLDTNVFVYGSAADDTSTSRLSFTGSGVGVADGVIVKVGELTFSNRNSVSAADAVDLFITFDLAGLPLKPIVRLPIAITNTPNNSGDPVVDADSITLLPNDVIYVPVLVPGAPGAPAELVQLEVDLLFANSLTGAVGDGFNLVVPEDASGSVEVFAAFDVHTSLGRLSKDAKLQFSLLANSFTRAAAIGSCLFASPSPLDIPLFEGEVPRTGYEILDDALEALRDQPLLDFGPAGDAIEKLDGMGISLPRVEKLFNVVKRVNGVREVVNLVGGGFTVLYGALGNQFRELALDPPDPNFRQVSLPQKTAIRLALEGAAPALVRSAQETFDLAADARALSRALLVALERAAGAAAAGDRGWEYFQTGYARLLADRLGDTLAQLPAAYQDVLSQVLAVGYDPTATGTDIVQTLRNLREFGFPADRRDYLDALGVSQTERDAILRALLTVNPEPGTRTLADVLADPEMTAALRDSSATLRRFAGAGSFAVGAGAGGGPVVQLYGPGRVPGGAVAVYEDGFRGGVRVAEGDVTGDGVKDLIAAPGPGRAASVRVYDGVTRSLLYDIPAFESSFVGGAFVATGDFNADGLADVVISADIGGGPRVRVISGADGATVLADFLGINDPNFRGGARVAVADVNGDGRADLLVAAGFGGGPRVAVYNGATLMSDLAAGAEPTRVIADFFAFEETLRNGVYLSAGDLNGDGYADIIAGGGPSGGPRVLALSGFALLTADQLPLANFFAGNPDSRGGVQVLVTDLDGDDRADLITGSGEGDGAEIRSYLGRELATQTSSSPAWDLNVFPDFRGGVFVG